jgi:hypothetical protein
LQSVSAYRYHDGNKGQKKSVIPAMTFGPILSVLSRVLRHFAARKINASRPKIMILDWSPRRSPESRSMNILLKTDIPWIRNIDASGIRENMKALGRTNVGTN